MTRWLVETVKLSLLAKNKNVDTPLHGLAKRALRDESLWVAFVKIDKVVDYSLITAPKNNDGDTVQALMIHGNQAKLLEFLSYY